MEPAKAYLDAIVRTRGMVSSQAARRIVAGQGLSILDITWEDTGRYKGSAVGPNISDMTIQVGAKDPATGRFEVACMPVIRYDNFYDRTADLDPRDLVLLVGNHHDEPLTRLSLHDFLTDPSPYLTSAESWPTKKRTLLADRDSRVLVSAQACFLPVPREGEATFNPVVFNYQSGPGNPAVLTVLATREGTSVTVIDNARDPFETGAVWGQRLFHNANGQRASLTGQRESEFAAAQPDAARMEALSAGSAGGGLNMVMLIQVPLVHKEETRASGGYVLCCAAMPQAAIVCAESDVEDAVIGHGEAEGPFTEMDGLPVRRDERFPVRVTVQFYKATSNGVITEENVREIRKQIDRVYAEGDYVGSLVAQGETGRVTEYAGAKVQPPDWWDRFWERHERDTGRSREETLQRLKELLGRDVTAQPVSDLWLRSVLRN